MKEEKNLWWSRSKKNFRIDFYRGSGKGGQHRNKRDTACRITDLETGISACSEEHKSQSQNKKAAFKRLTDRLLKYYESKEQKDPIKLERSRSYHEPEDRVIDHITGRRYSYKKTVGKGDISQMIEDRLRFKTTKKLEE